MKYFVRAWLCVTSCSSLFCADPIPWSTFPIADEVAISAADPGHHFTEIPQGVSRVVEKGSVSYRELPNQGTEGRIFAVRLGEGKGLEAKHTYCLEVDYSDDAPRSFYIINRGDDTMRGISCGASLPDSLYQYTSTNPEVLDIPQSGGVQTWRSVFKLQDRFAGIARERGANGHQLTPADGFWVIIGQPEAKKFPGSHGAAVSAIRLRKIDKPEALTVDIRRPPADLPQRHLFWREEMADGIISNQDPNKRGVTDAMDWYRSKIATMRFLGIDTYCKDLLEFGHNQGWDSGPYGGNDWVYQSKTPKMWENIVDLMGSEGIPLLPYYEYAGSVGQHGLGKEKRAKTLYGKADYTHISWSEKANADLTDPDTAEDFRKMLDLTVLRLKDKATFLGIWMRPRSAANPIGFGPQTLARYTKDTGVTVSITELRSDTAKREAYYAWWFDQRRKFLIAMQSVLKDGGITNPQILYTCYPAEPTPTFHKDALITDGDLDVWRQELSQGDHKPRDVMSLTDSIKDHAYMREVLDFPGTWGDWEWQHACPPADPQRYVKDDGISMTFPFNRVYTVSDPKAMETFRSPGGLAMIHHYSLNENTLLPKDRIGYHCIDMEIAGPACMLSDVLAVANGDPRWLGSLAGVSLTRGFPEYVRAFNAAFLALPASPSEIDVSITSTPGVIVRRIDGGTHGTWFAVCNVTAAPIAKVSLQLGGHGTITDAATGKKLVVKSGGKSGAVVLDLPAASLTALQLK